MHAEHDLIGLEQCAQAAKLAQQMPRQIHRAFAGYAGSQKYRQ
jgi:hypothetical protein